MSFWLHLLNTLIFGAFTFLFLEFLEVSDYTHGYLVGMLLMMYYYIGIEILKDLTQ